MGGDEFTALISEVNNRQEIVTTAQAIMEQFARPVEVSGQKVWINASMGIVMASMPRPGADDLLTMADTALYHAKDRGKGQFVLFEPSLPRPALRSLSLDADLRMAVQRNELVLHFQPIVTLDTLCIAGFEALIRWRHPRLGLLSPNEFIPMAEESGLIRSLGAWIIEQGCERLSVWQSVHGKPLTLNINLSALQFRQRDILSHLATISDRSGLMPGSLQLEITESVLMQDDGQTLKNLSDLHRLGFGIAIDDFGVGYSSLSYLKRFRVDSLKLDQSFMKDLDDPRSEALVKGTIQLGHSLGVIVVAEGIETREQLELLRKAGCDQGQGYLLGRPMDEFQVMDMLSSGAFLKPWVTEGKGVESDDAVTGKGWQAAVA
jgi:EAL domain-containing protein (putative c-di-GMP-specific phosphodiesterase class I)